jgi:hypothetical protein
VQAAAAMPDAVVVAQTMAEQVRMYLLLCQLLLVLYIHYVQGVRLAVTQHPAVAIAAADVHPM